MLVAVDLGTGEPLALGYVNEHEPQAVRRWVGKALRELQETVPKEWLWVLDEIHSLIHLLPPDGSQTLYTLWKKLPGRRSNPSQARSPMEQLRDLHLRLSEDWSRYCTVQSEPLVPWTNNDS